MAPIDNLVCHIETHNDHITLNIERGDPIYFDTLNSVYMKQKVD